MFRENTVKYMLYAKIIVKISIAYFKKDGAKLGFWLSH